MRRLGAALGLLLAAGCTKEPESPVCGLHAASEPVWLLGKEKRALSVGAQLLPSEKLRAEGFALLECFGGALKVLDDETVVVGELKEAKVTGTTIPRKVLKGGELVPGAKLPPAVVARYSDNRFTPASALSNREPSSADYFRAFFTPNGIENLAGPPREEGPSSLPPPSARAHVSRIHAGPLGAGGLRLEVDDEVVFAETDELATAALPEGHTYELGRAVRLVLPDGAEAELHAEGFSLDLDGPLDLRLR